MSRGGGGSRAVLKRSMKITFGDLGGTMSIGDVASHSH